MAPETPAMYCIICGDDLRHAPEQRCPECGAKFDPANAETFATHPSLLHRALERWPRIRRWIIEHHTSVHCLGCGASLAGVEPSRCPSCNAFYDPHDPLTVLRALHIVPPWMLRFRHIAPGRGVILPLLILWYAGWCFVHNTAHLVHFRPYRGIMVVTGLPATGLAFGWLGTALALHTAYVWAIIEPWWRFAPLLKWTAIAVAAGGFGTTLVWLGGRVIGVW